MEEVSVLKQLEELEVIESSELAVGQAFHAFRFNMDEEPSITGNESAE